MTLSELNAVVIRLPLALLVCIAAEEDVYGQAPSFTPIPLWRDSLTSQPQQRGQPSYLPISPSAVYSPTPAGNQEKTWIASRGEVPAWDSPAVFPQQPTHTGIKAAQWTTPQIQELPVSEFGATLPASASSLQLLPDGLLYSSYLAGPRESRIGGVWFANSDGPDVNDVTLGGRVGILRSGTDNPQWPEGWQLDLEGAAFPRLNLDENLDVDATDFRFGVPLSWRRGQWQAKFSYYHLSSHVGDEFIERNAGFQRINFSRNALVLGVGYFATPDLRLYAEADYGFWTDGGSDPWLFQFGFDYAPSQPTGMQGAPFVAANGFLREEVDFGGTFTLMAGWAWRADRSGHLLRYGLQYSDGYTTQLAFEQESEQLVGVGVWYDF